MSLVQKIKAVLDQDPRGVDAVRRVLRNTKSQHKELSTRDLNKTFQIPGYKFIKRENVFLLLKDSPGLDPTTPTKIPSNGLAEKANDEIAKYRKALATQGLVSNDDDEEEDDGVNVQQTQRLSQPFSQPPSQPPVHPTNQPTSQPPSHPPSQPQSQPLDINDQLLNLARNHALQKAQMKAEEEAKALSKSLQSALERAVESPSKTTQDDPNDVRRKQKEEEEWLKGFLKMKEEEQRREQKLTEERQLREKQEREQKQKEQHRQPSLEELIQSLAITHAEQTAKEETQRRAQTTIQKIFNAISQDGDNNNENAGGKISKELQEFIFSIGVANSDLEQQIGLLGNRIDTLEGTLRESVEEIIDEHQSMSELMEEVMEKVDAIYQRNYANIIRKLATEGQMNQSNTTANNALNTVSDASDNRSRLLGNH
jgi:hypothetical protein